MIDTNNGVLKVKNKEDLSYIKKSKTNKLTYQLECDLIDSLGTKFSYLIKNGFLNPPSR